MVFDVNFGEADKLGLVGIIFFVITCLNCISTDCNFSYMLYNASTNVIVYHI